MGMGRGMCGPGSGMPMLPLPPGMLTMQMMGMRNAMIGGRGMGLMVPRWEVRAALEPPYTKVSVLGSRCGLA